MSGVFSIIRKLGLDTFRGSTFSGVVTFRTLRYRKILVVIPHPRIITETFFWL